MKANDDMLKLAEEGKITGFSIEGLFGMQVVNAKSEKGEDDLFKELMDMKI